MITPAIAPIFDPINASKVPQLKLRNGRDDIFGDLQQKFPHNFSPLGILFSISSRALQRIPAYFPFTGGKRGIDTICAYAIFDHYSYCVKTTVKENTLIATSNVKYI